MFIPHSVNGCIFSYENRPYQFHYDEEQDEITFESFDGVGPADDMNLLMRLIELSEKAMKC
ncbi:hypothetical protein [Vibrio fortis]|uniref:hypothetical protein n=1 Tax=Vibrio fortis TaxID=212667 RepID=UPI0038CD7569